LSALVASVALAACGNKQAHPTVAPAEGTAASGFYVDAGQITYQVQISRELNPYATDDKNYLDGVSASAPAPSQEWFAVFLWAKNQSKASATTTDSFTITDTQGTTYRPIPINAQTNRLAWTPQLLAPGGTEPAPDSLASYGPTQGAELLFKIDTSAYSNRPLTLNIYAQGQAKPSQVSLDL
jgi:hypothetical protein